MEKITSTQNPKIKSIARLKKRSERDETRTFLIEGYRELKRALEGEVEIEALLFCEELFLKNQERELIEAAAAGGAELFAVGEPPFRKLSYRDRPEGLLAVAKMWECTLSDLCFKKGKPPFLLLAESIEKPGNLGSILRSSDAAGVDGVIVCDPLTDIYNPNVVRSSVGTLFTQRVIEASSEEAFAFLRAHQIPLVASTPSADLEFTKAPLQGPIALAVGTEQLGLSKRWLDEADLLVRIPMHGAADSLNVTAATTLLLYEVLRQRK
ncbi:MAG: rRNA methyltransferase [Chlamydiae bacterium GWC2_50_10]|nr:MAG: rRNA methyltransferase [Chlamydiae bacterium GWA2_50_15]OGN53919.1 MAG: rRNA methyltransferase [Chlamydiae bacterium GWC2_50_10]OGN64616.1 MAG: rRNA methyltransferase [Chlamydiae bacterium RIFCSPHIGHO2_12_FULL_49_32]OGN68026.1 MAG: rRNA methyltransferase [Chlamydiae bacterium RIFCSPLOWO2_02_FULL_49_12]OGN70584.1 MAG: rRNA methyltransferase [Chlamydiae bacterium RIFCSPLOWO2_12_FULL_49_12]HAZ15354.1 RNA methyltransferase [Parachlamydiales bacterium]